MAKKLEHLTEDISSCLDSNIYPGWVEQYLGLCKIIHTSGLKPIQWLKQKLGQQSLCTNIGCRRFWTWFGKDWIIYCNNTKGICFEVSQGLSSKMSYQAWSNFLSTIGLTREELLLKYKLAVKASTT